MKTLTYLFVCILFSFMYSCSSSEVDIPTPLNDQSRIKELQDFAKDCGYTDLMINICRPLTDKDIELYRSLIFNKKRTGRDAQRQQKMYLTEVGYDGGNYTLQFDYSFDGDTGEILEALMGVFMD